MSLIACWFGHIEFWIFQGVYFIIVLWADYLESAQVNGFPWTPCLWACLAENSTLKVVQKSRQQALRAYCPDIYTVFLGLDPRPDPVTGCGTLWKYDA